MIDYNFYTFSFQFTMGELMKRKKDVKKKRKRKKIWMMEYDEEIKKIKYL